MKKRIVSWLMWAAIVIMAIIPTWYFFSRITDPGFLDNSIGNWFATMIGVGVGIPIALRLSRWQQKEQEKKEQEDREREALIRKTKILRLVKTELEFNRDQLLASKEETDGVTKRVVFVSGLKDELWSAFSDGGELQWIRDLQLLYAISFAYHYIRRVIYLEKIYMEVKHFPGPPSSYPITPGEDLIRGLIDFDPVVLQSIEQALEEIDKSIAALESARKG